MLAKQGDAPAQASVGLMYARGYGIKKDTEAARKWWTLAAVQNEPGAQFDLGLFYARGNGVAQDYAQAFRWFHEAAMRGHVQAQHNLGMLYHEGKGTRRDPVNAYYWIAIAARQGDDMARKSLQTVTAGISREQMEPPTSRSMSGSTKRRRPANNSRCLADYRSLPQQRNRM
jgi:TPR repeat protein